MNYVAGVTVGGDVMDRNCPIYAGTPLKSCHWYRNEEIDPKKSSLRKFSIPYLTIFDYHFLVAMNPQNVI